MKTTIAATACAALLAVAPVAHGADLFPKVVPAEYAPAKTRAFFDSYFTAKTRHDIKGFMSHFYEPDAAYGDITLRGIRSSYKELNDGFGAAFKRWTEAGNKGLSYPTLVIGGRSGAVVMFTDTAPLLGAELRILAPVDFKNGKIVRWLDYWDGRSAPVWYPTRYRSDKDAKTDFHDDHVGDGPSAKMQQLATKLSAALAANDAKAAAALFSYDASFEDITLHLKVDGRTAIESYLSKAGEGLPYGKGSKLFHIVGEDNGGGYEWFAPTNTGVRRGVTAIAVDRNGEIVRMISAWDGALMSDANIQALFLKSYGVNNEGK